MPSVTVIARGSRWNGATGSACAVRPGPEPARGAHRMKLSLAFGESLFDERAAARRGRFARVKRLSRFGFGIPAPPVAPGRWLPIGP